MNTIESLKKKIEEERLILDRMVNEHNIEKSYEQSLRLDSLVEKYLNLTQK